jgi:glycosyltransferase involved in cell wall biosynthesis
MKSPINYTPLVSIVTPVYCQGEFLEATMRSVLMQDYPALEYIVIDDGSKDESLSIAKRIAKEFPKRIKVLAQPNAGQAATLNRGWGMAQGEILAYLSSDDCLLPQAVTRMVQALNDRPDASVAYCDFFLIDATGSRLREFKTENFSAKRLTVDLVCQPGPGAFFRRELFDRTGGWNQSLRQVPDFEFWLRAESHGPFVRVAESLAEYRIHEGSASFRDIPIDRAEEIVSVMTQHWSNRSQDEQSLEALARANIIAAKNHAQSGRVLLAAIFFARAVGLRPKIAMETNVWRQLLVGLLRQTFYRIRSRSH